MEKNIGLTDEEFNMIVEDYEKFSTIYLRKRIINNKFQGKVGNPLVIDGNVVIGEYYDKDMLYKLLDIGLPYSILKLLLNDSVFNDSEFMFEAFKKYNVIADISDELFAKKEFVEKVLNDEQTLNFIKKTSNAFVHRLKRSAVDNDIFLKLVNIFLEKGGFYRENVKYLKLLLPDKFIKNYPEVAEHMINAGFPKSSFYTIEEIDKYKEEECENQLNSRKKEKNRYIESIDGNTTVEDFKNNLSSLYRGNIDFMIEILKKNPYLYGGMVKELKFRGEVNQRIIREIPGIESIMDEDEEYCQYKEKQRINKEQRAILNKEKEEQKFEQMIAEYKLLGRNHPNMIFIQEYMDQGISKIVFCKNKGITIAEFDRIKDEVKLVYPDVIEVVDKMLKKSSEKYFFAMKNIYENIVSGKWSIKDYANEMYKGKKISDIVDEIKDQEVRRIFHIKVVEAINSGELTVMDLNRLFSKNVDFKIMLESLKSYLSVASKEVPELQKNGRQISTAHVNLKKLENVYSKPFQNEDFVGCKRGFADKDGNAKMHVITEEMVEYAKRYLKANDEYICYKTVDSTIVKLIKGEITYAEIDGFNEKNTNNNPNNSNQESDDPEI